MSQTTYSLGHNATFTGLNNDDIIDATITHNVTEVDATTRGSKGKKQYLAGLEDFEISVKIAGAPGTTAGSILTVTAGTMVDGLSMLVSEITEGEPMDGLITYDIKLKPAAPAAS